MFEVKARLTKENILKKISEYDIFKAYCPNFEIVGKSFSSPFRKDSNPSCRITMYKELKFRDFSEDDSYNCFDFVMKVYNLSFLDTLIKINQDFSLGFEQFKEIDSVVENIKINWNKQKIKIHEQSIIRIEPRSFNLLDKEFWWDNYHIPSSRLISSKTYPVSHIYIKNEKTNGDFIKKKMDNICYAYYFYEHNGIDLYKIYSPYRDKSEGKWISNIDNTVIDGIEEIEKSGDLLIITKSRKDRLLINELGYPNVVGTNNEGSFIPEINVSKLKDRYKRIVIYFDNDSSGFNNAKKFSNKFNIDMISNHREDPKDITDFQKKFKDFNRTKQYIEELLNE